MQEIREGLREAAHRARFSFMEGSAMMTRKLACFLVAFLFLGFAISTHWAQDDSSERRGRLRQHYEDLERQIRQIRSDQARLLLEAANKIQLAESDNLRQQAASLEQRAQSLWYEQTGILREGDRITRADAASGGKPGIRRRLQFLDVVLSKLRNEKRRLERKASNVVKLEDGAALRRQADQMEDRIRYLETERTRWQGELNRQRP